MGKKRNNKSAVSLPFGGRTHARVLIYEHVLKDRGTVLRVQYLYWGEWVPDRSCYHVKVFDLFNVLVGESDGVDQYDVAMDIVKEHNKLYSCDFEYVRSLMSYQPHSDQLSLRFTIHLKHPLEGEFRRQFEGLLEYHQRAQNRVRQKNHWDFDFSKNVVEEAGSPLSPRFFTPSKLPDHAHYKPFEVDDLRGLISELRFLSLVNIWLEQGHMPSWMVGAKLATFHEDMNGIDVWIHCSDLARPIPVQIKTTFHQNEFDEHMTDPRFLVAPVFVASGVRVKAEDVRRSLAAELNRYRGYYLPNTTNQQAS